MFGCSQQLLLIVVQDGNAAKQAVRSLTMAVERGECFGLLGPNGAGKVGPCSPLLQPLPSSIPTASQGCTCDICLGRDGAHSLINLYYALHWGSSCIDSFANCTSHASKDLQRVQQMTFGVMHFWDTMRTSK